MFMRGAGISSTCGGVGHNYVAIAIWAIGIYMRGAGTSLSFGCRLDTCVDMCVGMCKDMCVDICIDMLVDMCVGMFVCLFV